MCTTPESSAIPKSHVDLLESSAVAHVATVGIKGEPQVNPVWFGWDGVHITFSQTTTRQKFKDLQRDPRISLSIVDPANPYRYLEVRGKVVRFDPDPDFQFINSMAKKYLDQDVYPWRQPGEQRVVVVIEPERSSTMG